MQVEPRRPLVRRTVVGTMATIGGEVDIEALCAALHPRLVSSLALHCGDRDVAAELAQEALARLWERWPSLTAVQSPEAWTYRVAFNLAASRYRRRAAERRAMARAGANRPPAPPEPADALAVRAAVLGLPPRQRAVVVLRYYADLTVDDVAAVVGCAPGTVKSLTSRAVAALRRSLGMELHDGEEAEGD